MKIFRNLLTVALVVSLFASFAATFAAEPTEAEILETQYQIVDFEDQGNNGFYFMYLDKADMQFKEMSWNNGYWCGPYDFLEIRSLGSGGSTHPAENGNPAYAFAVEYSGKIKVNFEVFIGSNIQGDQTGITVYKNDSSTKVWPVDADYIKTSNPAVAHEFELDVKAGDMIYVVVDKIETISNDNTFWNVPPCYQYLSLAKESDDTPNQGEQSPDTADSVIAVIACAFVATGTVVISKKKAR